MNVSGEATKSGVEPSALVALASPGCCYCRGLRLRGLDDDPRANAGPRVAAPPVPPAAGA